MLRLIAFLVAVALVAAGLAWLADRPGEIIMQWQGYQIETSVFRAIILLAVLVLVVVLCWSLARNIWHGPATVGGLIARRRQQQGLDAISSGMIALGAGDKAAAMRAAIQARKSLPNEPLTHLLRAQAAQLSGDRTTSRRIFEAMLASPDTEQLGLRGLFLEAQRVGETEAASHFAERAVELNPKLSWAVDALFDLQCKRGDWDGALETLATARKNGQVDRATADRRRAVLLTAQAQAAEDRDPEHALTLALEAHGLAPNLVPAAAIAGRLLASRGNTPRAAKILQRTWSRAPQPDLATAYAYARIGDSPRDRLDRVKQLAALSPNSIEGPIAIAGAAIEARQFDDARAALEPLLHDRMTQRVATLMARIEAEQHADKGRVREWLARAVHAARDPAWTADGVVAERWAPTSPVSGTLDAFQWRVPVERVDADGDGQALSNQLEELVALATPRTPAWRDPDERGADGKGKGAPFTREDAQTIEVVPRTTPAPARASGDQPTPDRQHPPPPSQASAQRAAATAATDPGEEKSAAPASQAARQSSEVAADAKAQQQPREAGKRRSEQARSRSNRPGEPRIFVAPRAPDDPGPEAGETEEVGLPLRTKPA
jgi:HemY protein